MEKNSLLFSTKRTNEAPKAEEYKTSFLFHPSLKENDTERQDIAHSIMFKAHLDDKERQSIADWIFFSLF